MPEDPEERSFAKRIRNSLEYIGLHLVEISVPLFPLSWLRILARVAGWVMYNADSRTRKVALANLTAAFGDTKTPEERKRIACRSMQVFAQTMLELFWSPNFSREKYQRYASVEMLGDGKPPEGAAIYYCHHFANFEWLSFTSSYAIISGIVIAQQFENPRIGEIFNRLRSLSGHEVIAQEKALVRMFKLLKGGGKFGVLTDLVLDPRAGGVIIEAFGMKMCVTPLTGALVKRTGARLVPCECLPGPDGRYIMRYHAPLEVSSDATEAQIIQQCWSALEPSIREHPECWLWGYKHWRFRPDVGGENYPFYAVHAGHFEKLLKRQTQAHEKTL
ncbi:MAG: lysophospholipid acyltransferase family protein [Chthoniobacterales bacterium]